MTSTRHAIVALVLPFLLGAGLLFNLASERWVFAGLLFLALLGFVGFEYARWVIRDRRQQLALSREARRAAGPLFNRNCTYDADAYFTEVNRRWAG